MLSNAIMKDSALYISSILNAMRFQLDQDANEISFFFNTNIYRKEALYGAGLVFSDRAFTFVEPKGPHRLKITLQLKNPAQQESLRALAGEFHNELLNQTLRWMVARHNKKTKEAIQTQALFAAHASNSGIAPRAKNKKRHGK